MIVTSITSVTFVTSVTSVTFITPVTTTLLNNKPTIHDTR